LKFRRYYSNSGISGNSGHNYRLRWNDTIDRRQRNCCE